MNCPNCNVTLVMSDKQGIEIDYCPKCRGVWLDRGELDKIIERSAGIQGRPNFILTTTCVKALIMSNMAMISIEEKDFWRVYSIKHTILRVRLVKFSICKFCLFCLQMAFFT
jgi:hypothetical protein